MLGSLDDNNGGDGGKGEHGRVYQSAAARDLESASRLPPSHHHEGLPPRSLYDNDHATTSGAGGAGGGGRAGGEGGANASLIEDLGEFSKEGSKEGSKDDTIVRMTHRVSVVAGGYTNAGMRPVGSHEDETLDRALDKVMDRAHAHKLTSDQQLKAEALQRGVPAPDAVEEPQIYHPPVPVSRGGVSRGGRTDTIPSTRGGGGGGGGGGGDPLNNSNTIRLFHGGRTISGHRMLVTISVNPDFIRAEMEDARKKRDRYERDERDDHNNHNNHDNHDNRDDRGEGGSDVPLVDASDGARSLMKSSEVLRINAYRPDSHALHELSLTGQGLEELGTPSLADTIPMVGNADSTVSNTSNTSSTGGRGAKQGAGNGAMSGHVIFSVTRGDDGTTSMGGQYAVVQVRTGRRKEEENMRLLLKCEVV